jgi:hypothetical protein
MMKVAEMTAATTLVVTITTEAVVTRAQLKRPAE